MTGLLGLAVLGLVIGATAKLIMPGDDGGGLIMTSLLGIGGSMLGGFFSSALGLGTFDEFSIGSFVAAVIGALVLLYGYNKFTGSKAS